MSEDTAGYAQWAERLGKVRLVRTGEFGGLVVADGDGAAAEAMLRQAAWERPATAHAWAGDIEYTYPPELMTSGACIATMQAQIELLFAKVAALETENIGLRTNIANLEHRCTCMEGEL